nr:reverse transcriptase domain-containing protein [Tanacetum cinerariifolium]
MMAIFYDMIEKTMEVFMDDFSVSRNSFGTCLSHLDKMLKRCEDTNICLNWEKSHFMVKERIVLGHKISKNRIEVDHAKVDVIAKLPHPTTVKGIHSFLGHVGFYRRFIQDFSKIARPMTRLLEKDTLFFFSKECIEAFQTLKKKLTETPILVTPDWDLSFELLCDASDFTIVQLNELNELRDQAYENSLIYKEKTKRIRDSKIKDRVFNVGDRVLHFNSRLNIFSSKLKTRWTGPFTITQVFPYGTVELSQTDGPNFRCMHTRSSSNLVGESSPIPTTSNLKRRNRRRSKQSFSLEESPLDTMADQRTMAEFFRAPTEGYAEAIVVPPILTEHFKLKHSLINMMTFDQFFVLEKDNPHDHIRWFNKITSTIKYKDVPNSAIKIMLFPFSLAGEALRWVKKEPPRSILTWEDLVSKFINEFFPPSRTTKSSK